MTSSKTSKRLTTVLLIDCLLDPPYGSSDILRHLMTPTQGRVLVQRGPGLDQNDQEALKFLEPPLQLGEISHMIISGSRTSCLSDEPWIFSLLELIKTCAQYKTPILGICFGHQMIARAFGGKEVLGPAPIAEKGWIQLRRSAFSHRGLASLVPPKFGSAASHVECVHTLPAGFERTFENDECSIQGLQSISGGICGVQFHPERKNAETDEENFVGIKLIQDFLAFEKYAV